jgi:hypothetical protein
MASTESSSEKESLSLSFDVLMQRQQMELKELEAESKKLLKAANKSNRAEVEARIIQMEYDLKAKHRDEEEELEERLGDELVCKPLYTLIIIL